MLTRLASLLRFGLVLALPAAALACGDQTANDAPIIDSVEAPLVVTEQNGSYAIPVTVLFHDNDGEAVTRLHYRMAPNVEGSIDVPAPNPTRESTLITIVIKASELDDGAPSVTVRGSERDDHGNDGRDLHGKDRRGARSLQLSIVDGRGAESLPQSSTVTLD
ncbi:MAG: hypothetical protein JWP87_6290 [Labilithrix sp.]|nr:hypothetical protein [Labilithrix sp.]